ncbi:hypothetical protein EYF88_07240 [Paracoccus sediminis]|uniref:Uncharacterized protein n=1 Tax=Paracoccus sediminis TaxID=1214787 RepID=A0ABY1YKA9_9RHOB|nr:hypothetical protein [Paracoccus sediminis]TBN51575.1 hypothetical protein EYF88_07240 [Paracoccus sediminis]
MDDGPDPVAGCAAGRGSGAGAGCTAPTAAIPAATAMPGDGGLCGAVAVVVAKPPSGALKASDAAFCAVSDKSKMTPGVDPADGASALGAGAACAGAGGAATGTGLLPPSKEELNFVIEPSNIARLHQ